MRAVCWAAVLGCAPVWGAAAPSPSDWVPARWQWNDAKSLELLTDNPINCLLLKSYTPDLVAAAAERGLVTLAVITPGGDPLAETRKALSARLTGVVLEGDFAADVTASVRDAAGKAPVIELTSRSRMKLGSGASIIGTYQGVWPGVVVQAAGHAKSGPTGSVWIDTNTGFIRAVRAWGDTPLWIGNEPPADTVITSQRYLQVIADAAASGGRWVISLDTDLAAKLAKRDGDALRDWQRMGAMTAFFERHPEWRHMSEFGKLALVQDPSKGGLLSGGILDMIAVKHTPVRPIPREHLTPESLRGATMAVNVDADALTPEQKDILRSFTRGGGMLLTGPPGWKDQSPKGEKITLDPAELERLNDIWKDVNSMVGRRNLGVRLFNVASMLSNVLVSADGKSEVVHIVNYSDYPVENVSVHYLGEYKHATLITPEGAEKVLEVYPVEEGWGVDIDKVSVCATIRLEL
ncbi:MAG TPA: hypothetical protein VG456_08570 [Candidatus Sulfopaludibacter sp.]|nr:hypothetical protein [Candidatus Sulfopaludibacter sp.]